MPIDFDFKNTAKEILDSTLKDAGEAGKEAKEVAKKFLKNREERLKLLAELRLDGDLDNEKFNSRLEDEKLLLEAELKALGVFSKAKAQKTANTAMNIFQTAVSKAVSSINI